MNKTKNSFVFWILSLNFSYIVNINEYNDMVNVCYIDNTLFGWYNDFNIVDYNTLNNLINQD